MFILRKVLLEYGEINIALVIKVFKSAACLLRATWHHKGSCRTPEKLPLHSRVVGKCYIQTTVHFKASFQSYLHKPVNASALCV